MPTAVLNYSQYQQFQANGEIPLFTVNSSIPSFRGGGGKTNLKLFPDKISDDDLWYLYSRCDIAANAVDIIPQTVWGKRWTFKTFSADGGELQDSPLEKAAFDLTKQFNVNGVFEEAHRYARCVRFGLVIAGLADNKALSEPAEKASTLKYLAVYSGDEVEKVNYNTDLKSDDYGEVESYLIKGEKPSDKFTVHASRCWHIAEKKNRKHPHGVSVLESAYDLFQILKNTDWSAGEAYYQNASPLYVLSWDDADDSNTITPTEKEQAKTDLDDLHARKRIIKPKSWTLEVVSGSGRIADPQVIWNPTIERIAGAVGTPKQLLLGTSAGALASGETNLAQWYGEAATKQTGWAEPILNDFYSRLQKWGVLPEGNIAVQWPSLWEMDAKEKAEIMQIKVASAVAASQGSMGGQPVMTVEEAREKILEMNPQVGSGSKQNFQVNAPIPAANHTEFATSLIKIKDRCVDGELSEEQAVAEAKRVIDEYGEKKRLDSLRYLQAKTGGTTVKEIPKEMQMQINNQKTEYMTQFKRILEDALDEPNPKPKQ
jgi:phage-related protein (TIGR01555 family)